VWQADSRFNMAKILPPYAKKSSYETSVATIVDRRFLWTTAKSFCRDHLSPFRAALSSFHLHGSAANPKLLPRYLM
jgi:hypothetical protein